MNDLHVEPCKRALYLENEHLWLGESDCGWHRPLIATFRNTINKGGRQRSEAAIQRRLMKRNQKVEEAASKWKSQKSWNKSWDSGWTGTSSSSWKSGSWKSNDKSW
jgi:hypothetical protein